MATRGKEIQDFIKENKKTARERFEEAGWHFDYDSPTSFGYSFPDKCWWSYVRFIKESRVYYVILNGTHAYVDMETHKLINYQLQELGWL